MKTIPFSKAKSELKSVLDDVANGDYAIISRRDGEDVVVMSMDQFNSLMETVHLLKSPANTLHLEKSIAQYRAGKTVKHGLTDD